MSVLESKHGIKYDVGKECLQQSHILQTHNINPKAFSSGTFGDIFELNCNDTKKGDKIMKIVKIYFSNVQAMHKHFSQSLQIAYDVNDEKKYVEGYKKEYAINMRKFSEEVEIFKKASENNVAPHIYDTFVCKNVNILDQDGSTSLYDIGFIIVERYTTSFDNVIYTIDDYKFSNNVIQNFIDGVWKSYQLFGRLNVDGIQPNNILINMQDNNITKMIIGDWGDFTDSDIQYPINYEYVKNRILDDLGLKEIYDKTTILNGGDRYRSKYLKYKKKYLKMKI